MSIKQGAAYKTGLALARLGGRRRHGVWLCAAGTLPAFTTREHFQIPGERESMKPEALLFLLLPDGVTVVHQPPHSPVNAGLC